MASWEEVTYHDNNQWWDVLPIGLISSESDFETNSEDSCPHR